MLSYMTILEPNPCKKNNSFGLFSSFVRNKFRANIIYLKFNYYNIYLYTYILNIGAWIPIFVLILYL